MQSTKSCWDSPSLLVGFSKNGSTAMAISAFSFKKLEKRITLKIERVKKEQRTKWKNVHIIKLLLHEIL